MFFYIDPGTGSMLFTILIGLFGTAIYALKLFKVKIKTAFGGKKSEELNKKVPIVIYSDDKRYWSIFKPIVQCLDEYGKEILYLTASEDDGVFKEEFKNLKAECIGKDNASFFRLNYINASIVLSTTPSLGVFQWKRSKKADFYVHIPHASNDVTLYRMFGIDYYDAVLLSGEYQAQDIRALEQLRNLPQKELVQVGIPYMDQMAKRLEEAGEIKPHPTTVLLAPSWGSSAILGVYGERIIERLIDTGYNIIIRPHPQSFSAEKELMESLMEKYPPSDKLEWNRDTDNFEVLRRSDILISDFSGVIFDFTLIYGKPVIYTNPNFDLSPYDAWWLNKKLWTVSALERVGKQLTEDNFDKIKELIDDSLASSAVKDNLKQIKEETWCHFGEGAERAGKYLIDKLEELTAKTEEQAQISQPADKKGFKQLKIFNLFKKKPAKDQEQALNEQDDAQEDGKNSQEDEEKQAV